MMVCGSKSNCIFCDTSVQGGDIVGESDELIVIRDKAPAAATHLLVIPRRHIESVKSLTRDDILLDGEHSVFIGSTYNSQSILSVRIPSFGFHIPPHTSIGHLHLHCFSPPFHSWRKLKYLISRRKDGSKGFSWFAEVGQVLRTLRRGGQVQIWPEGVE
ncbi:hypothetical protein BS47DRAFT_1312302 [Hydnum rufescens UP504]|uniref:HIT domain-containing protein n=1 Tax=Hydnum rufescens UP504 TaxID=1448309 RepID=A0A9P6B8Q9_9AGAM|nr:hypothetical protein BS47DRAFT_1312302 [Hydnum rufescens UP504]